GGATGQYPSAFKYIQESLMGQRIQVVIRNAPLSAANELDAGRVFYRSDEHFAVRFLDRRSMQQLDMLYSGNLLNLLDMSWTPRRRITSRCCDNHHLRIFFTSSQFNKLVPYRRGSTHIPANNQQRALLGAM